MPRDTKKGIVLLAIGLYSTSYLFIKVVLAAFHHIKWMIFERCCYKIKNDGFRVDKLKKFWEESFENYYKASA